MLPSKEALSFAVRFGKSVRSCALIIAIVICLAGLIALGPRSMAQVIPVMFWQSGGSSTITTGCLPPNFGPYISSADIKDDNFDQGIDSQWSRNPGRIAACDYLANGSFNFSTTAANITTDIRYPEVYSSIFLRRLQGDFDVAIEVADASKMNYLYYTWNVDAATAASAANGFYCGNRFNQSVYGYYSGGTGAGGQNISAKYLRVQRIDMTFKCFTSADGVSWGTEVYSYTVTSNHTSWREGHLAIIGDNSSVNRFFRVAPTTNFFTLRQVPRNYVAESANTTVTYRVDLSKAQASITSVKYETSTSSRFGESSTAAAANDYTSRALTTLNIPAGSTSASFTVGVTLDANNEAIEQFIVQLSAPSAGMTLGYSDVVTKIADRPWGEEYYITPGDEVFLVPAGVNQISIAAVGAGGGGSGGGTNVAIHGSGGGGGALRYANNVAVTPGEILYISVGAGGAGGAPMGSGSMGGPTFVTRADGTTLVQADPGRGGTYNGSGGAGGALGVGSGTTSGGAGGGMSSGTTAGAGGGGGAAGWTGNGGAGATNKANGGPPSGGSGGGGTSDAALTSGSGGGGMGLFNTRTQTLSYAGAPEGKGGSPNGAGSTFPSGFNGQRIASTAGNGGIGGPGGGGGGGGAGNASGTGKSGGAGGGGIVRIVWGFATAETGTGGGTQRSFPNAN